MNTVHSKQEDAKNKLTKSWSVLKDMPPTACKEEAVKEVGKHLQELMAVYGYRDGYVQAASIMERSVKQIQMYLCTTEHAELIDLCKQLEAARSLIAAIEKHNTKQA